MGVVVADDLVATVAHAVAGEDEVTVDGRPADVAAIDTALDAAVLRVDGEIDAGFRAAPLVADVLRRVTIRTTDIYGEGRHTRPGLELAADVKAGDSGTPVVDADGVLLGLVWARSRERDGRAWALPVDALAPLIDAAVAGDPVPPVPCSR